MHNTGSGLSGGSTTGDLGGEGEAAGEIWQLYTPMHSYRLPSLCFVKEFPFAFQAGSYSPGLEGLVARVESDATSPFFVEKVRVRVRRW